jgi:hypothetical protein
MPDLFENLRGLDVRVRVLDVATPTPSRAVIPTRPSEPTPPISRRLSGTAGGSRSPPTSAR